MRLSFPAGAAWVHNRAKAAVSSGAFQALIPKLVCQHGTFKEL